MDAVECANATMAMRSLDIAIDDLNDLVDDVNYTSEYSDPEEPQNICSYTRIVHTIVWRDREPASIVHDDVIPLLQKAVDKIDERRKQAVINKDEDLVLELSHYKENSLLRKVNLESRYLKGLSTNFAWDEIEPRLKSTSPDSDCR